VAIQKGKKITMILEQFAKTSRFYAIKLFAMLNKYISTASNRQGHSWS
jgi:hypothetical protein